MSDALQELVKLAARTELAEKELRDFKARLLPFWMETFVSETLPVGAHLEIRERHVARSIGEAIGTHPRAILSVDHGVEPDGRRHTRHRVYILLEPETT